MFIMPIVKYVLFFISSNILQNLSSGIIFKTNLEKLSLGKTSGTSVKIVDGSGKKPILFDTFSRVEKKSVFRQNWSPKD